jgi:hypothetical protein
MKAMIGRRRKLRMRGFDLFSNTCMRRALLI